MLTKRNISAPAQSISRAIWLPAAALLASLLALGGCGSVAAHHPDAGEEGGAGGAKGTGGTNVSSDAGTGGLATGTGGLATGTGGLATGTGGTPVDAAADAPADAALDAFAIDQNPGVDAGGAAGDAAGTGDAGDAASGNHPVTAISLGNISTFAAPASVFTKVPYAATLYDDRTEFDLGTSRFTATDAGDYQICASLTSSPNVTLGFELDLYVNGVRERAFAGGVTGAGFEQGCRIVRLPAGAYVEVWVNQASSSAVTFSPNSIWNWMTISKVQSTVSVDDIAPFSAAANTFTKVTYLNEVYDDQSQFDPTTSRFTAAAAGDYQICASLISAANPTLDFELDLYVNGARARAFAGGTGSHGFEQGCRVLRLAAADYVEVWVDQSSSSAVSFGSNTTWNWMTVAKIPSTAAFDDSSTFSAAQNTFTKVPYTTVLYDDQSQLGLAQSRFMAAQSGDFQFCASLTSSPDVGYGFELDLYINGARERALGGGGDLTGFAHGCRVVRLVAGNYVEVWINQSGETTMSFPPPPNALWNWLTVSQLR